MNNKLRSYKYNNNLIYKKHKNNIKSFKKINYFYDPLFKYCLRLNYINNVQKNYRILKINYVHNFNKNYNTFFNITKII